LAVCALGLIPLAGLRWRWVRVPAAILVAAVSLSLLEIMPGGAARAMSVDIAGTPCAECYREFLVPMADRLHGMGRTIMVPVTVLGIWAVVGDRWSRST